MITSPRHIVLLMIAGALGTLARYGVVLIMGRAVSSRFPIGTLTVNIIGCFLFGLVFASAADRSRISPETRDIVLIGFFGAFTTFSTFAFDAQSLWRTAGPTSALAYILASNLVGIAALLAGMRLARLA